jgi:steroid 5-alpha reductase family enzyme
VQKAAAAERYGVAVWPACVATLAVVYTVTGDGWPPRRSAIAFMMASWGARLAVQSLFTGASDLPRSTSYFTLLTSALFFSLPALFPSRNPDSPLSPLEIAASVLWLIAFAGETTADRQRLRFMSAAGNAGVACRSGLWRWSAHIHAMLDVAIWIAFALFASASPWGWLAWACPAAMAVLLVRAAVTPRC